MATKRELPEKCQDCDSRDKGIFCALGMAELDELSEHKIVNRYKKGQQIFSEGNPPIGLYCVSHGNVKLTKMNSDGKESIVRVVTGGDVIGHRSLFTKTNYSGNAVAIEDTIICFVDKKYIMQLIQEEPTVASEIIHKLSKELGASGTTCGYVTKVSEATISRITVNVKRKSWSKNTAGDIYQPKLTREEMASMIGTATETLIRSLSELKDEGSVILDGKKVIVVDELALIELINFSE